MTLLVLIPSDHHPSRRSTNSPPSLKKKFGWRSEELTHAPRL
jgi:hypothetical protein